MRLDCSKPAIQHLLAKASEAARICRGLYVGPITVTSGNDSKAHVKNSRHYTDEAIDLRSHNFISDDAKLQFADTLMSLLGPRFIVMIEAGGTDSEHFHAQVRRKQTFP